MKSKLSRKAQARNRLMRNQLSSLILFESVTTTVAKAKALKAEAQSLVSKLNSSTDEVSTKRYISSVLYGGAQLKAFDKRLELLSIRTFKLHERFGDGAPRMIVKLIIKESAKAETKKESKTTKSKK